MYRSPAPFMRPPLNRMPGWKQQLALVLLPSLNCSWQRSQVHCRRSVEYTRRLAQPSPLARSRSAASVAASAAGWSLRRAASQGPSRCAATRHRRDTLHQRRRQGSEIVGRRGWGEKCWHSLRSPQEVFNVQKRAYVFDKFQWQGRGLLCSRHVCLELVGAGLKLAWLFPNECCAPMGRHLVPPRRQVPFSPVRALPQRGGAAIACA